MPRTTGDIKVLKLYYDRGNDKMHKRISVNSSGGRNPKLYVDIREFYLHEESGELRPGRGATLPISDIGDIADVFSRIAVDHEENGFGDQQYAETVNGTGDFNPAIQEV